MKAIPILCLILLLGGCYTVTRKLYRTKVENVSIEDIGPNSILNQTSCIKYTVALEGYDTVVDKRIYKNQIPGNVTEVKLYVELQNNAHSGRKSKIPTILVDSEKIADNTWLKTDSLKEYVSTLAPGENTFTVYNESGQAIYTQTFFLSSIDNALLKGLPNPTPLVSSIVDVGMNVEIMGVSTNNHFLKKGATNSLFFYIEPKPFTGNSKQISIDFSINQNNLLSYITFRNGTHFHTQIFSIESEHSKVIGPFDVYISQQYPGDSLPLAISLTVDNTKKTEIVTTPMLFSKPYWRP